LEISDQRWLIKLLERVTDQLSLERFLAIRLTDLDEQALAKVPRSHTRRIERLDGGEHRLRFFHRVQGHRIAARRFPRR
jgi:hypothetical protein